jgi:hypothetical protein
MGHVTDRLGMNSSAFREEAMSHAWMESECLQVHPRLIHRHVSSVHNGQCIAMAMFTR